MIPLIPRDTNPSKCFMCTVTFLLLIKVRAKVHLNRIFKIVKRLNKRDSLFENFLEKHR